jgi:hypothetical protein
VRVFFASPQSSVSNGSHLPKLPKVRRAIQIIAMLTYFFRHTRPLTNLAVVGGKNHQISAA